MNDATVLVHRDPAVLAHATAARLVVRLVDVLAAPGNACLVLTGGRSAAAIHRALRDTPAQRAVDWSRVDFWWGDERFLPYGHPDRNETQARAALLDSLPVDPARVHPMPASDGPDGDDPEAAARRYASELASVAGSGAVAPHFDLLLLGIGDDGHVASIFPEHPAGNDPRPVVAVRDSPKPPPVRITLTPPMINSADEVWLVAAGARKAAAVREALTVTGPRRVPAAVVHGSVRTLWLLDRAASAEVP